MVSFVWSAKQPFLAGRGGSENYTAGQIRELQRRGIPCRVITIGYGEQDGRDGFPDISFLSLASKEELSTLDDTLVFVTYPLNVPTKKQSYAILHCPMQRLDPPLDVHAIPGKQLVVPSKFAASLWGKTLRIRPSKIPVAYPFAEPVFAEVERVKRDAKATRKVLFAGRLLPDKGIYTLLAALHMDSLKGIDYELSVTDAASDTEDGQIIRQLLEAHPKVNLIPARKSPAEMAQLMAEHDIAVMPTTNLFWQEIFGIVSVEAQHAGCRVVASNGGGLSETDCGGAIYVKPDDPGALASGLAKAIALGPLTQAERLYATTKFTVHASVNSLLKIMERTEERRRDRARLPLPIPLPLPSLQKQGSLVREQLDVAFDTLASVGKLGLGIAGKPQLASRKIRGA